MAKRMVLALLAITFLVTGCKSIYDCSEHVIQVSTRGKLVKAMTLSGPGCENAVLTSDMPVAGAPPGTECGDTFAPYCQYYYIDPHAAGDCTVHIELDDGETIDKTATFTYSNDEHCGGFYPQGGAWWNLGELGKDADSD